MRSVTAVLAAVLLSLLCLPASADTVGARTVPVVSPPLGSLGPADNTADVKFLVKNMELPRRTPTGVPTPVDHPIVQNGSTAAYSPDIVGVNFDGVGVSNSAPPTQPAGSAAITTCNG